MQEVKGWIGQKTDECADSMSNCDLGLGYVCASGTHRAVGLNRLVTECLRRDGYIVSEASHLSRGIWTSRNRCYWCNSCKVDNPDKPDVFEQAYSIWSQL